jgi:hypothetical protein
MEGRGAPAALLNAAGSVLTWDQATYMPQATRKSWKSAWNAKFKNVKFGTPYALF